jgi:hypothetical protein
VAEADPSEPLQQARSESDASAPAVAFAPPEPGETHGGAPALSRHVFFASWAAAVMLLLGSAVVGWDNLVRRLVETPAAAGRPAPLATRLPAPSAGDRALAEARRLLDDGQPGRALAVLDAIPPEEAAYPFARQVRAQAVAQLRHGTLQP